MERIVVGIDGSAGAQVALAWAAREAREHRAALTVLHAWGFGHPTVDGTAGFDAFERAGRQTLDDAVASVATDGVDVEKVLVCGAPVAHLIEVAKGADLLVVGTRGLTGLSEILLGSVSHHVTHLAPCPVVVVPD